MEDTLKIRSLFMSKSLKVTPQRIAVYKALMELKHPCAEDIITKVHQTMPTITVATIYNVLECLAQKHIIEKVNTCDNKMYFDADIHDHHHLYCEDTHQLLDYFDEELTQIIHEHLKAKSIPEFDLSSVQVQLIGKLKKEDKHIKK